MSNAEPAPARANIVGFGLQERRLGSTILRTYRQKVDIDDVVPNERQPRLGPKEDEELQRQIEANEGLFEPLLVEPHPDLDGKFRIIDGERRWTNSLLSSPVAFSVNVTTRIFSMGICCSVRRR